MARNWVKLIPWRLSDAEREVSLPGREDSREFSNVGVGVWPIRHQSGD